MSSPARGEWYLSPGLGASGGYTSNRFEESGGTGSSYSLIAPSLDLTWLGPESAEGSIALAYARTDYLESGAGSAEKMSVGVLGANRFGGTFASLTFFGGVFEDSEQPWDDFSWLGLSPTASWKLSKTTSAQLGASIAHKWYDSRQTFAGRDQADTTAEAVPAFRWWGLTPALTFWSDLPLAYNDSNADQDDYWSAGAGVGVDIAPAGPVLFGLWARWARLDYRQVDRTDTPVSAGAWCTYRLAPWAELTASGTWLDNRSTVDSSDYTVWLANAGIRFIHDWKIPFPGY